MKLKVLYAILLLPFLYGQQTLKAQGTPANDKIPVDSAITTGKLSNGMEYYIRENKTPEKQGYFRIVVYAGAINEDEDQNGLAHFTEHMCFNGTKNFPKNELVNFLEKQGIRFGSDLNAGTRQDYTTYELPIPMGDPAALRNAFRVLEDWAHNVTMASEQIDGERGVIVSEWRQGRSAGRRLYDIHMKKMYYNSKYAQRNVIGDTATLLHFPYEAIRRFYHDWYRPDLMAFVAVGDFNKTEIEGLIKEYMGSIPPLANPREHKIYDVPDHKEVLVSVAADKEQTSDQVSMYFLHAKSVPGTKTAYREDLVKSLYNMMFSDRLQELTKKPEPPFVGAYAYEGDYAGNKGAYAMIAQCRPGDGKKGMGTLLDEAYRVVQHGFTQTELDYAKKNLLSEIEKQYQNRKTQETRSYVGEYTNNFIDKSPIPGIAWEFNYTKSQLPGITIAEINALSKQFITKKNAVITYSTPSKEGLAIPTEAEILKIFNDAGNAPLEAYKPIIVDKPLFSKTLKPVKALSEKKNDKLDLTELNFPNGTKVIFKKTKFKEDEIQLRGFKAGGTSLATDDDYVSAQFAANLVNEAGISGFDQTQLEKLLTGKNVNVSPSISELWNTINATTTPQDLETAMQLLNLYFTDPRRDDASFQSFKSKMKSRLASRSNNPETAFGDTLQVVMSNYSKRDKPVTAERLDLIKPDKAYEFYKARFGDANGFTFLMIGNFDPEQAKKFAETYIASLPSTANAEKWKDLGTRYPKKKLERHLLRGKEDRSHVRLSITGDFESNRENRYLLNSLTEVLKIRFTETIREEKSGVYSPAIRSNTKKFPAGEYQIFMDYICQPSRVNEMIVASTGILDDVIAKPDVETLAKVKKAQEVQFKLNLERNDFWMENIVFYTQNGEDPNLLLDYPKLVENLKPEDIQKAAQKYLVKDRLMRFVLDPEKQ
ncbi:MAG: insulinase family protein [Bacteroidota bacterium]